MGENHVLGLLSRYMPDRPEKSLLEMMANGERLNLPMRGRAYQQGGLLDFSNTSPGAPGSLFPGIALQPSGDARPDPGIQEAMAAKARLGGDVHWNGREFVRF